MRIRSWAPLLSLLLIAGGVAAPAASPLAPDPVRLSADQRRQLDRGEVVVIDRLPAGGDVARSAGGTAVAVVHAPQAAVWRVLVDYRHHSGLYPRVVAADVLESGEGRALVRYVVTVGPFSFGFHVNNYPQEALGHLAWRLARERRNDLFRDSWGYWQVDADPRGSIVTYAMAARTVLPTFLTRGAERDGLVETVRAVRARAEQAG